VPHILHVISTLERAGAQRQVVTLLRAIGAEHRMSLAYLWGDAPFARELPESVRLVDLSRHGRFDPISPLRLARWVRREQVDLVHTHLVHAGLVGKLAARWAHRPVVTTRHYAREAKETSWPYRLEDRWTRDAAAVIAVSGAVREHLVTRGACARERVHLVPNAVDGRFFEAARLSGKTGSAGERVVGAVGRLHEQKGFDLLLEAWASISAGTRAGWKLEIVGEGDQRRALAARIVELGLSGEARLIGAIVPEQMPETYLRWGIVVQPSRWEAFGLAAAEAMVMGRCVVATSVEGLRELIVDGVSGLLVPAEDREALAARLARAIGDPDLRDRLGQGARVATERFRPEANAAATLAVYKGVLEGRSAGTSGRTAGPVARG